MNRTIVHCDHPASAREAARHFAGEARAQFATNFPENVVGTLRLSIPCPVGDCDRSVGVVVELRGRTPAPTPGGFDSVCLWCQTRRIIVPATGSHGICLDCRETVLEGAGTCG